jgi:hypothetical protein
VSMSSDAWARRIGLAVGLVLALAAVLSWRIPAEGAGLGADARFVAVPPGELTLEPSGAFLSARRLRPGDGADGRLSVRNIAGAPVAVRVRGLPSARDLDRLLTVELEAGGARLFRGPLGDLREWTRPVVLDRGEARAIEARARLSEAAGTRAAGAEVDVTVELSVEPRRG